MSLNEEYLKLCASGEFIDIKNFVINNKNNFIVNYKTNRMITGEEYTVWNALLESNKGNQNLESIIMFLIDNGLEIFETNNNMFPILEMIRLNLIKVIKKIVLERKIDPTLDFIFQDENFELKTKLNIENNEKISIHPLHNKKINLLFFALNEKKWGIVNSFMLFFDKRKLDEIDLLSFILPSLKGLVNIDGMIEIKKIITKLKKLDCKLDENMLFEFLNTSDKVLFVRGNKQKLIKIMDSCGYHFTEKFLSLSLDQKSSQIMVNNILRQNKKEIINDINNIKVSKIHKYRKKV